MYPVLQGPAQRRPSWRACLMPAGLGWHLQRSKERAGKALSNMSRRALLVPVLAWTTEQTAHMQACLLSVVVVWHLQRARKEQGSQCDGSKHAMQCSGDHWQCLCPVLLRQTALNGNSACASPVMHGIHSIHSCVGTLPLIAWPGMGHQCICSGGTPVNATMHRVECMQIPCNPVCMQPPCNLHAHYA